MSRGERRSAEREQDRRQRRRGAKGKPDPLDAARDEHSRTCVAGGGCACGMVDLTPAVPLTPARAHAAGVPAVDVLALMLGRWLRLPAESRAWIVETNRRCAAIGGVPDLRRAEAAAADVLEALDMVAAEAGR